MSSDSSSTDRSSRKIGGALYQTETADREENGRRFARERLHMLPFWPFLFATEVQKLASLYPTRGNGCAAPMRGRSAGTDFRQPVLSWEHPCIVEPYDRDGVSLLGQFVRHAVISNFPGADEKQKLNAVFSSAPPWLIWFTFADYTAKLLKLKLPDLSDVRVFERSKENFDCWWGLPSGAFERRSVLARSRRRTAFTH